jgi:hypothetical protein
MIIKAKLFKDMNKSVHGLELPLMFNNEIVGKTFISDTGVTMVIDKHEREIKEALSKPGLSGFSMRARNE